VRPIPPVKLSGKYSQYCRYSEPSPARRSITCVNAVTGRPAPDSSISAALSAPFEHATFRQRRKSTGSSALRRSYTILGA
jgi:hypothetical protein